MMDNPHCPGPLYAFPPIPVTPPALEWPRDAARSQLDSTPEQYPLGSLRYDLSKLRAKRLIAERTKWERMTQAIDGILNPPIAEGKS